MVDYGDAPVDALSTERSMEAIRETVREIAEVQLENGKHAFPLVRRLCAETNVVGFDLVELLPYRDPGYTTVLNSNRLVRECLVGLAMRKRGITEEHYLSPLTADDGLKQ